MKKGCYVACCLCVLVMSGCIWYHPMEEATEEIGEDIVTQMSLQILPDCYYIIHDRWPDSLEELREFCAESEAICGNLDMPDHLEAVFRELPNGDLEITYSLPQGERKCMSKLNSPQVIVLTKPSDTNEWEPCEE